MRPGRGGIPTSRISPATAGSRAPAARSREPQPSEQEIAPELAELAPGAEAERDGLVGPAGMNGLRAASAPQTMVIPPREHTERERLAMRPEIRGELGALIDDLHGLFEREITAAKRPGSARCGICYLHFPTAEMDYREADGFYVCEACNQAMRGKPLRMVRRQPRTGG